MTKKTSVRIGRAPRARLPRRGLNRDELGELVRKVAQRMECSTTPAVRPRSMKPADVGRYAFPHFLGMSTGRGEESCRIEDELKALVLDLLRLPATEHCLLTASGTESIFLAMLLARRTARYRGDRPEIVVADNLHPCILLASQMLGITVKTTASGPDGRASVNAFESAISSRTILLVASAPSWGRGVLDPVEDIVKLGARHEIACHVDGCAGALLVPFLSPRRAASLANCISKVGQVSISVDLHKYAYAPSNLSALCAFGPGGVQPLRFACTEWDGFRYITHGVGGERPVAPIVAAWAVIRGLGRDGFQDITGRLIRMRGELQAALRRLPVDFASAAETAVLALTPRSGSVGTLSQRLAAASVANLPCIKPGFVRIRIDPLWSDAEFSTILKAVHRLSG